MKNSVDEIDEESISVCLGTHDSSGGITKTNSQHAMTPTRNTVNELSSSSEDSAGIDLSDQLGRTYVSDDVNGELLERLENALSGADGENLSPPQQEEDVDLPSRVRDRKEIFMPLDLKPEDPRIYGKWLWFSNGNLDFQDYVWIGLAKLLLSGEIILMESSTARRCPDRGPVQGVIKCYTRGDKDSIRRAGVAMQKIINDDTILNFKSNEASKDNRSRSCGDRFITDYMLTVSGKFYEKDKLDRWVQVKDTPEEAAVFDTGTLNYVYEGFEKLPSREFGTCRYVYPLHSNLEESLEIWSLFCDAIDTDKKGMTELDRMWMEAKKLVDEGVFYCTSCETKVNYFVRSLRRRTISCTVGKDCDIDEVMKSGDRLRERLLYNLPMYLKVCRLKEDGKWNQEIKYLYTDDCNLYEYVCKQWKLVKNKQ